MQHEPRVFLHQKCEADDEEEDKLLSINKNIKKCVLSIDTADKEKSIIIDRSDREKRRNRKIQDKWLSRNKCRLVEIRHWRAKRKTTNKEKNYCLVQLFINSNENNNINNFNFIIICEKSKRIDKKYKNIYNAIDWSSTNQKRCNNIIIINNNCVRY